MYNLYGVANHSPAELHAMLNDKYDVRVCQFDKRLEKATSKRCVILCPTIALFNANRAVLNECKQASVLVFDTAVKLEYLKPVELLDVEAKKVTYVYKFKGLEAPMVRRALEKKTDVRVSEKTVQLIPTLLSQTHDSFIAMIMNFLYGISNTENREEVKRMVFSHLSENQITPLADKLEKKYKRNEQVKAFIRLLRDGKANSFALALQEITKVLKGKRALRAEDAEAKLKATNYKKISKEHDVSKWDLTYSAKYIARMLTNPQPTT